MTNASSNFTFFGMHQWCARTGWVTPMCAHMIIVLVVESTSVARREWHVHNRASVCVLRQQLVMGIRKGSVFSSLRLILNLDVPILIMFSSKLAIGICSRTLSQVASPIFLPVNRPNKISAIDLQWRLIFLPFIRRFQNFNFFLHLSILSSPNPSIHDSINFLTHQSFLDTMLWPDFQSLVRFLP